jgi:cell shape-determining protein MreC
MTYAQLTPVAGKVQQGYLNTVDVVQKEFLGTVIAAVDSYFGFGEFQYVQFPASAAITQGQVLITTGFGGSSGYVAAVAPITANTGAAIAVAINSVASVASIQYGWVQISGAAVTKAVASVAAGQPVGIDATTAGSVNANSAGRQVLSATSLAPSTNTVVKLANLTNGSPFIKVSNVDGIVPGLTVSGTGVSGTVVSIDPDSRTVLLSANATAGTASSVTFTYTGFVVVQLNRSFLQGAIT